MKQSYEEQWSFEKEKFSKFKSKKVFRAQMLIDLEHQKLLQEKIYERKIKNIEQKV